MKPNNNIPLCQPRIFLVQLPWTRRTEKVEGVLI
jgi:hypothetical protein